MPRASNNVASRRRRKKILSLAKGNRGARSKVYTIAKNTVEKGLQYQYRDRRVRKRNFRALWITRINAGARQYGVSYSRLMGAMHTKNMEIDRKLLADLAVRDIDTFGAIVKEALS